MQFVLRSLRARGVVSALALAGVLTLAPASARAADAKHFGVGSACALSNVLYGPAKLMVAIIGSVTAGFAYAVTAGDIDVARKVLDSSVMGDYVIEPAHIRGEKPLEFIGNTTPPPADDWSAPPANSGF
jgi:type IV secretory pathway VirB2 component (pilin)